MACQQNRLTELVMGIVDTEDRNRIRPLGSVKQRIENMIADASRAHARNP